MKIFPFTPNAQGLLLFFITILLATLFTIFWKNFQIFKELI